MLTELGEDETRFGSISRDARNMLRELHGEEGLHRSVQSLLAGNGKQEPCFCLPKRETMVLVTGYSIPLRARVIDRLEELEAMLRAQAQARPWRRWRRVLSRRLRIARRWTWK